MARRKRRAKKVQDVKPTIESVLTPSTQDGVVIENTKDSVKITIGRRWYK